MACCTSLFIHWLVAKPVVPAALPVHLPYSRRRHEPAHTAHRTHVTASRHTICCYCNAYVYKLLYVPVHAPGVPQLARRQRAGGRLPRQPVAVGALHEELHQAGACTACPQLLQVSGHGCRLPSRLIPYNACCMGKRTAIPATAPHSPIPAGIARPRGYHVFFAGPLGGHV